jgi:hypothetical protein
MEVWARAGEERDTNVKAVVARKIDMRRVRCGAKPDPVAVNT